MSNRTKQAIFFTLQTLHYKLLKIKICKKNYTHREHNRFKFKEIIVRKINLYLRKGENLQASKYELAF